MALTWNLENIEDYENKCWVEDGEGQRLNAVTETLIWMTMAVGIGDLSAKNAPEFAARIDIIQQLDGPLLRGPDGPVKVTTEDVLAHIGLSTNVFPVETRAKWLNRTVKWRMDAVVAEAQKALVAA